MKPMLEVQNLVKRFDGRAVVDGLSFAVQPGEVFALLGVNGAGKTTTLSCIEGLLAPDEGRIACTGTLGVQLQNASLPPVWTVAECLECFARWGKGRREKAVEEALGLTPLARKPYEKLSTGQQRRLHLALALLRQPQVLLLDEPTAGLDVEARHALHEQLRRLQGTGTAILLASHDMAEVETLCQRLVILRQGRAAYAGTVEELTRQTGKRVRLRVTAQPPWADLPGGVLEADSVDQGLRELLALAGSRPILDLQVEHPTLEQRFLELAEEVQA